MISRCNYSFSLPAIYPQHALNRCCPISAETTDKIKKVVVGVISAVAAIPVFDLLERKIVDLLRKFGIELTQAQEVFQLWNFLNGLSSTFLSMTLKAAFLGYIVIVGPILEEYLFRHLLHWFLKSLPNNPDSTTNKILRVVGNGFIFGACHLSPFQGWTNVPIFIITFAMGCVFAALRERTGDITASSAAHITNNGIAMFQFLRV